MSHQQQIAVMIQSQHISGDIDATSSRISLSCLERSRFAKATTVAHSTIAPTVVLHRTHRLTRASHIPH